MTAEDYIKEQRVFSTGLEARVMFDIEPDSKNNGFCYKRKDMIEFAEKYHKMKNGN